MLSSEQAPFSLILSISSGAKGGGGVVGGSGGGGVDGKAGKGSHYRQKKKKKILKKLWKIKCIETNNKWVKTFLKIYPTFTF